MNNIQDRGPFRRKGIERYMANMSVGNDHVIFDDRVAKILSDQGIVWDEKPRSIYEPKQLWAALAVYDTPSVEIWDRYLESGALMAHKVFAKTGDYLTVLKGDEEIKAAVDLTKSSGLPNMSKKIDDLIYALDRELQVRKGLKTPNPCLAFKRTQANNKTRLVWGYPFEMTIMEARFARPLIDRFLNKRTTMAFGYYKSELGGIIESEIRDPDGYIYALDYSKFDTTISKKLIYRSFSILKTWFHDTDLEDYQWDRIINYFVHTTIVMPDGHLYVGKRHGIPSGSYFTQIIGSIVNTIILGAISDYFKLNLSWRSVLVLGDDSIFSTKKHISIKELSDFTMRYGMKINISKSKEEFHFLGAVWEFGRPNLPLDEIVSKALFPETFRKYGDSNNGAFDVLISLAAQYSNGYKLLPLVHWTPRRNDIEHGSHTGKFLSGSDQIQLRWSVLRSGGKSVPRISMRALL